MTPGPIGKAMRLYQRALQLRARWRRTPPAKRLELAADLADVVRARVIRTGTRPQHLNRRKQHGH